MPRVVKLNVDTGFIGAQYDEEVDLPEGWDDMTEAEQDNTLNTLALEYMYECIECCAYIDGSSDNEE